MKIRSSTKVVWSQKVAFMLYSERVKNLCKRGDRGCLLGRENPKGKGHDRTCGIYGTKQACVAGTQWTMKRV